MLLVGSDRGYRIFRVLTICNSKPISMLLSIVPSTLESSPIQPPCWFKDRGIPPERVGLNGEYDHAGLVKRVHATLQYLLEQHQWDPLMIDRLRIAQRGQVVILSGQVENQDFLDCIIESVLQVEGAAFVESNGIRLTPHHRQLEAA
jgi:hypothetical protein